MTDKPQLDAMFSTVIGQEYELLKLICPLATEMSRLVGLEVRNYQQQIPENQCLKILELGSGTGITTLNILTARENLHILTVDNEPVMQKQAQEKLQQWQRQGKITFANEDALIALKNSPSAAVDIVASAYTLHNFPDSYRKDVITEVFRVLKPGGRFINADRYALDDMDAHTRLVQKEVARWFDVLIEIQRLDLLEHWVLHLLNDESENHVMRESKAFDMLLNAGFTDITFTHRQEVNAVMMATRP